MVDIWYMDSEFCEQCDALLDEWGICPGCGWFDGVDEAWDDDEEAYTLVGFNRDGTMFEAGDVELP